MRKRRYGVAALVFFSIVGILAISFPDKWLFPAAERIRALLHGVGFRKDPSAEVLKQKIRALQLALLLAHMDLVEARKLFEAVKVIPPSEKVKAIPADVVGREPALWFDEILVNRGRRDGVKRGMPVVAGGGLIGRVDRVWERYASVRLVTSPRIRVPVTVGGKTSGILTGDGRGSCKVSFMDIESGVVAGDRVETLGLLEGIPAGIPVGEVTDVRKSEDGLFLEAIVRTFAKTSMLEHVFVLIGEER